MIPVLYVDDNSDLLTIGKRYLERSGKFTVNNVKPDPEVLEILNTIVKDAVVSDYQKTDMDGISLLTILRQKYPALPIIIFTGKCREDFAIGAFDSGADYYVKKGGTPSRSLI